MGTLEHAVAETEVAMELSEAEEHKHPAARQ
jgi:hypothetical protein